MTIHKNPLVKPFVKWAGGKRQLLPDPKCQFKLEKC